LAVSRKAFAAAGVGAGDDEEDGVAQPAAATQTIAKHVLNVTTKTS
jgi:hypothetical protein